MTAEHWGPWIATFLDGPLAGPDQARHFSVGPIKQELTFAPLRLHAGTWTLVGYDTLPVEHPWDGQVTYRLQDILDADEIPDELAELAELGDPIARYEVIA